MAKAQRLRTQSTTGTCLRACSATTMFRAGSMRHAVRHCLFGAAVALAARAQPRSELLGVNHLAILVCKVASSVPRRCKTAPSLTLPASALRAMRCR